MAVSANNETLVLNTPNELAWDAATSSVIDEAEVFTFTPDHPDNKYLIIIDNTSALHGAVGFSVAAGGMWAAGDPLTGSVAQAKAEAIVLEGGKYKSASGTIEITLTPASGKRLLTDHAVRCIAIKMP